MVDGLIMWDDEDDNVGNDMKGYIPDFDSGFYYDNDTLLYYCCQNKGKWYNSIQLPTEKPFYLLPYGSPNCQRVMGAVSSLEYIVYDTEDFSWFYGNHVYTDESRSLPKIFYCYYEGTPVLITCCQTYVFKLCCCSKLASMLFLAINMMLVSPKIQRK